MADVTDYKTPGTAATVDRDGERPWSDVDEAKTDNDVGAHCPISAGSYSNWLRLTNFGFDAGDIPVGATIEGIEVKIKHKAGSDNRISDSALYLRKTSGQVGDNKASAAIWGTGWVTITYGASDDGWNAGLTQADIVNSNFGIDFSGDNNWYTAIYAYVDCIWIRIHYTAGFLHELVLTDGFDIGEVLIKNPIKVLSDGIAVTDTLVKALYKVISDGIKVGEAFAGYKILSKVLTDGIAVGEVLCKHTIKILIDGIAFTDVFFKLVSLILVDGIAVGESLIKMTTKVITDVIKFTDIRFTTFIKVFVDGIKFHDFLLKWRWLTPLRILKPKRLWQPKRRTEL